MAIKESDGKIIDHGFDLDVCPFCGSTANLYEKNINVIKCSNGYCGCSQDGSDTLQDVIDSWNKRV